MGVCWCGVNRAGCGACVCAIRPAGEAQSAKQPVWTDYRGPGSLTLCCSYGRYLVGNATADITRIRHIQYIVLEQKSLYPSMHAVVLSCSSQCKPPLCLLDGQSNLLLTWPLIHGCRT